MSTEQIYKQIAKNIDTMTELQCKNDKLLWNEAIEQAAKVAKDWSICARK